MSDQEDFCLIIEDDPEKLDLEVKEIENKVLQEISSKQPLIQSPSQDNSVQENINQFQSPQPFDSFISPNIKYQKRLDFMHLVQGSFEAMQRRFEEMSKKIEIMSKSMNKENQMIPPSQIYMTQQKEKDQKQKFCGEHQQKKVCKSMKQQINLNEAVSKASVQKQPVQSVIYGKQSVRKQIFPSNDFKLINQSKPIKKVVKLPSVQKFPSQSKLWK